MNVKTDTKEKFRVITPLENDISANMAEELANMLLECPENEPSHVILNMDHVKEISPEALEKFASIAEEIRSANRSFVVCCLQNKPLQIADDSDLLVSLNYAPTESEAWDILQMEEIERELLGDEDNDINP
jgi:anti-anti-sigma factor